MSLTFLFWGLCVLGNVLLTLALYFFDKHYLPSYPVIMGYDTPTLQLAGQCLLVGYGVLSCLMVWVGARKYQGDIIFRDLANVIAVFIFIYYGFLTYYFFDPNMTDLKNLIHETYRR